MSTREVEKLKKESRKIQREVVSRTVGYIIGAFGLVAGLAWNEAIKGLIDYLFPLKQNSLLAKFIYATIITMIVVLVTVNLMRIVGKQINKK